MKQLAKTQVFSGSGDVVVYGPKPKETRVRTHLEEHAIHSLLRPYSFGDGVHTQLILNQPISRFSTLPRGFSMARLVFYQVYIHIDVWWGF